MFNLKRRKIENIDKSKILEFAKEFNISEALSQILLDKGLNTAEDVDNYIRPKYANMHDPFLFNNMQSVVQRINEAVVNKEKIAIWGDYDVDGITSVSILGLHLSRMGADILCKIPDRGNDGYGLNRDGIYELANKGCRLLITVDCGITNIEEIAYAKSVGMDVIVTDHHEPKGELPECIGILNPKVSGERYPFKELCGAGVAGKLVHGLSGQTAFLEYIDLIGLATVADIVPLVDENRIFVMGGLHSMNTNPRLGIRELCEFAMGKEENIIKSYHLGFRIGPMINACGRIGNPSDGVTLLTTGSQARARKLAEQLHTLNGARKEIEKRICEEAISQVEGMEEERAIVVWGDNWDAGVIGIVASRLVEKYYKPTIVLSFNKETGKLHGSCRSIDGINIVKVLDSAKEHIIKYGGHTAAAGLTLDAAQYTAFVDKIMEALDTVADDVFVPVKVYDSLVRVPELTEDLVAEIEMLEPCGMGNPKVKFLIENTSIKDVKIIGSNREHFSCNIYDDSGACSGIAFQSERPDEFHELDIIVSPSINEFNGARRVQCILEHYQESAIKIRRNELSKITTYGVRLIDSELETLGIEEKKIKQLKNAGINSVRELLEYLPTKYYDFRYPKTIKDVENKETCCILGKIVKIKETNGNVFASCLDADGTLFVVSWFRQYYVARNLKVHQTYAFCGQVNKSDNGFTGLNPKFWGMDEKSLCVLKPEYKKIKGMSAEFLEECIRKAIIQFKNTDYLTEDIVDEFGLMSEYDSIVKLHKPGSDFDIRDGKRRKVFDILFKMNFNMKSLQEDPETGTDYPMRKSGMWDLIKKELPYELTVDQAKALNEMKEVIDNNEKLNCLVQGDVGTGKTIVAFFLMAMAAENGYQSCVVAPTEVLARQHYEELHELMKPFGINVGYLVGGMKAKERRELLKGILDGSIHMVVGTHAVVQDSVEFKDLGVVVVDEQHRFGVKQREKLLQAGKSPHIITMSATPIPRTLSMALHGESIRLFNIKTKPAGRKEIVTQRMFSDEEVNMFMLEEIRKGRQCYVVCPLIEESASSALSSVKSVSNEVTAMEEFFKGYPEVKITNVTGKMKQKDINEEIGKFARLETNILISTTIIEVGVNVPNATVMVMKSSERFGLAQAHQLRGRVGRGSHQSYCLLQTEKDDVKAEILCNTSDGFDIAQEDLALRGTGDFLGTQQTGKNKDVMLMMAEPELYSQISELNNRIFANSSLYAQYKYLLIDDK